MNPSLSCLFASTVALLVSSCSSAPPKAMNAESTGVCISVDTRAPVRMFSNTPDSVLFVMLPEGEPAEIPQGVLYPSNYESGGYFYLLNAKPGRYVAVASFRAQSAPPAAPAGGNGVTVSFSPGSSKYTTYFPSEMVRTTVVDVKPGEIAFMGSFIVDMTYGLEGADPVQTFYYRLLAPGDEQKNGVSKMLSGDNQYRGEVHASDHSAAAIAEFEKKSRADLETAGWSPMVH